MFSELKTKYYYETIPMIDSTISISCGQSTYFCYVLIHKLSFFISMDLRQHIYNLYTQSDGGGATYLAIQHTFMHLTSVLIFCFNCCNLFECCGRNRSFWHSIVFFGTRAQILSNLEQTGLQSLYMLGYWVITLCLSLANDLDWIIGL